MFRIEWRYMWDKWRIHSDEPYASLRIASRDAARLRELAGDSYSFRVRRA